MKIGLVEKILIALAVTVVLASFVFAINASPVADRVVILKTLDMTCGSCARSIEKALQGRPGVVEVTVAVDAAQVAVAYDSKAVGAEELAGSVTAAGYRSGIVRNLSMAQYREITGQTTLSGEKAKSGGCGSGCCN